MPHLSTKEGLAEIARRMVAPGKGILAADESTGTIEKRLKSVDVLSTEETRRAYRQMLLGTAGLEEFISGVILYDETLRQKTTDGVPFAEWLSGHGILAGIKVDKGAKLLSNFPGEKITEGLDGLRERLAEYHRLGARFTKWRAVIGIGPALPSRGCLAANAQALARFAALSQEAGLVPIVEPEVLMEGDHSLETCEATTALALKIVFDALFEQRVALDQMLLKPNMVIPGMKCPQPASVAEVAETTLRCLRRVVPAAVPGIVFLSGGQSEVQATQHLNALNQIGTAPWELSFSYGRALQHSALETWRGQPANVKAAQAMLYHRTKCNSAARSGKYTEQMENHPAAVA